MTEKLRRGAAEANREESTVLVAPYESVDPETRAGVGWIAPPDRPLDRARAARLHAAAARESAEALTAQATHQLRRADRNRAALELRHARALVVDDSAIFLEAAAATVSAAARLRLVGVATSGEEAIRLLPELEPDLVLLDVHMPGIGGVEAARVIGQRSPETVVVLVSAEATGLTAVARAVGAAAGLDKADLRPHTLDALWARHQPRGQA